MSNVLTYACGGAATGLILWTLAMAFVRSDNFKATGERLLEIRGGANRSDEIKYHNEAIYRDFEYFFKITLAILGGVAFVATRKKGEISLEAIAPLLEYAGWLQVVAGVMFSLFIVFHAKSKIERWKERFSMTKTFQWQECWMVVSMFAVSASIAFGAIPVVIEALNDDAYNLGEHVL